MALQKNVIIPIEYKTTEDVTNFKNIDNTISDTIIKLLVVNNAYIKIINNVGDKNSQNINVGIFNIKNGILLQVKNYIFAPNISENSSNFIKQGYEYLKTLDEYKNAIDLLDEGQTV